MDVTDDKGADENEILPSDTGSYRWQSEIPQLFIHRRRRGSGVLAELEPISETNTLGNYSFNSKDNLSFTDFAKQKKKHDKLSRSISCIPSSVNSNSSFLETSIAQHASRPEDSTQTTPPGVLKKRLNDLQDYMQKQLDELREFTTAERQILLAEKGFEALQEEHGHLKLEFDAIKEQNSNLTMELEKSNQINASQKELINNLNENFETMKRKLIAADSERTDLQKELEITKRKLVDEEFKNELIENKLKKREDELKKSLEEAWKLNKIKDERLTKMKDKVSLIYTERILSNDFLNQSIPIEKLKGFDSRVADLYNLSLSTLESCALPVGDGGLGESSPNAEPAELNEKLIQLQHQLEAQNLELLDLTNKLKEKEEYIDFFNCSLTNLSYSFEYHKNVDNISSDGNLCSISHENIVDKVSCEFSHLQQKHPPLNKSTSVLVEVEDEIRKVNPPVNIISDSGVSLETATSLSSTDFSSNNLNVIISRNSEFNREKSFEFNEVSCQTDLNFVTIADYEKKVSDLKEDLVEASKNTKNIIEMSDICCQTTEDVHVQYDNFNNCPGIPIIKKNKSVQSFKDLLVSEINLHKSIQCSCNHEEASCQTESDSYFAEISNLREEINTLYVYKEEVHKLKSEFESYKSKNPSSSPRDSDSCNNLISNSSLNECPSEVSKNELKVQDCIISSCPDTVSRKDSKSTQTDENCANSVCISCLSMKENTLSEGNNESIITICESDESLKNSKMSENDEDVVSSDGTFETTSQFISDKSAPPNTNSISDMTLSDSNRLESSQDADRSNTNNNIFPSDQPCLFDYVETPVPDITTINMTFSSQLEHSILKSKLSTSVTNTSDVYDPLATENEFSKPVIETPFSYSLGLIGETKLLENKCKMLSDELNSLQAYNWKCLSILTEMDRLLCPQDQGSEGDMIIKAEETISLLKEIINTECEANVSVGLIGSYKNVKSMLSNLLGISKEVTSLKSDHISLSSYVHSLGDMNKVISKAHNALADLSQKLKITESSNKLVKDNFENLLIENNELKEQLSQLKSQNCELQRTSLLYEETVGKYKDLQNILIEKEQCLKEVNEFKYILQSFINNAYHCGVIEKYEEENQVFDVQYSKHILCKIEKLLLDLSNSYKLIDSVNLNSDNLTDFIESLFNDKHELKKLNDILSANLDSVREKVLTLEDASSRFKNSFDFLRSDFLALRNTFSESLCNANKHIEQLIKSKLDDLTELHKENLALKCQVNEISSCSTKYSESSSKLEYALKDSQMKYEGLVSKYTSIENENNSLKTSILKLEDDICIKSKEVENLQCDLKKIKEVHSGSLNVLNELNTKHSELSSENIRLKDVICNLEKDILNQKDTINFLEKESLNYEELKKINSELTEKISLYEIEIQQKSDKSLLLSSLQNENEDLKVKLDQLKDTERLFSELQNKYDANSTQVDALNTNISELRLENEVLKSDHEKYLALTDNLHLLIQFIKNSDDSFDFSILKNLKGDYEDLFIPITDIFSELKEDRKNLYELKLTLENLKEEKTVLVKNLQSLNMEKEISIEDNKKYVEDMKNLIQKEQVESKQLREVIKKYDTEVADVLSLLQYEGPAIATDDSWTFIKQNISQCRSQISTTSGDEGIVVSELKSKLMSLESQLLDSDNFKRKFSREIHGMKPDLKVPDLIKQSLEDLQHIFLSTIMEKERAIITNLETNFELKLTQNSDFIRQLQEEGKRNHDWIKEIENENEKLQNDCRQIQLENDNLKLDIKEKKETILKLEKQIEKQKDTANESLYFDPYDELEQQEKEKSFIESNLQDKINDLTRTLESKNKECQEAFDSLQNKSKVIFQLERTVNDTMLEKSHLEEEVKRLKEELISQMSSYHENIRKLETEIDHYRVTLDNFTKNENSDKCVHNIEIPGLVTFLEKLSKDTDDFLKNNVENHLDNHLQRVDKLNSRLKELSIQFNNQNDDLKNKENIISQLEVEVNKLRDGNVFQKDENDLLKIDITRYQASLEETELLRKREEELLFKLEEMKGDKEALIQASIENQKALKDEIIVLTNNLKLCQSELDAYKNDKNKFSKIEDGYYELQEESKLLNSRLKESEEEKKHIQEVNNKLNEEINLLHNENSKIQNSLEECLKELEILRDSNKLPKDSDESKLKEELISLNNQITNYQNEIENLQSEKTRLVTEFLDSIEFERSLLKSIKSELSEKENDLLNLEKERNALVQELIEVKQSNYLKIENLEKEILKVKDRNHQLHIELCSIQKLLNEKNKSVENLQSELESIHSTYHSEENCPYKKETLDYKNKLEECSSQLSHDREIFELWKVNMDQDIQCKVLLIKELESKLSKEVQESQKERTLKSELCCKLSEMEEKLKKVEEKVSIQQKLLSNEQIKLEQEIKKKEKYESEVSYLQQKCEELVSCINIFLKEVSASLGKEISDLGTVSMEINALLAAVEKEKENVKQLDEECEILNKNISWLERQRGELGEKEYAVSEHLKQASDKIKEEQATNVKLSEELKTAKECISSLQKEIHEIGAQYQREKKAAEINIANLLEDKQKLLTNCSDLEMKVSSLSSTLEGLQKKENQQIEHLMSEVQRLNLKIIEKSTKINNLEMRLVGDGLPFQRRAEAAENKVKELNRELKSLKFNITSRETTSSATSPFTMRPSPESHRRQEKDNHKILELEEEIRKLQKDKSSLKKIALLRHKEINELKLKLGLTSSQDFSHQDSLK